jgi:hypothetical protein
LTTQIKSGSVVDHEKSMIAAFVEPELVASARYAKMMPATPILPVNGRPPQVEPKRRSGQESTEFWTDIILESLRIENGPMAITTLVNAAAKWGDFNRRVDREQRKVQLFKIVGGLIRTGMLDRVARNFVVLPASDERRKAYLKRAAAPVDLPAPRV